MNAYDVSTARYTNNPVIRVVADTDWVEWPVNLKASTSYVRGQMIGEILATPGVFGPYVAPTLAVVSNVALTSNVATITTSLAHGFAVGQYVTLAGLANLPLNGTYVIASTPSGTTFTFAKTNANITSAADTGSASATTGAGKPRAVLTVPCSTDASGNITVGSNADPALVTYDSVPAIFIGIVRSEDVSGLDAVSAASLGRLLKGTYSAGYFKIG